MARRRRARRNPRNSKGRFVKRARRNPTAKRRRRARRANPTHRRRKRRVARANPSPIRRRRRRARRNPFNATQRAEWGSMVSLASKQQAKRRRAGRKAWKTRQAKRRPSAGKRKSARRRTKKSTALARRSHGTVARRRKSGKRRWRKVSKGMTIVRRYRKAVRKAGKKRSLRRSIARVQYQRASVIRRAGNKSVVAKAMHLKMNPGFAGVMASAKVLVPQGAVAAGAMIGLAMGGKAIASRVTAHAPAALVPYVPAIATLGLTGLGYVIADKVAPKFKGAVAIGGIIGAIIQAVVASTSAFGAKVQAALLGEYTMVGGGIFRGTNGYHTDGVGEYTMVGDTGRPRGGERDNATNWALNGADDHTEFAPGEGGVLSGSGIFRT